MRELAKYSFANAKIRAMLSYLIEPSELSSLADTKDIYELCEGLKKTVYRSLVEQLDLEDYNLKKVEKDLLRQDIAIYRKVHDALSSRREKALAALLLERYEVEELKVILRIWHKKAAVPADDYIIAEEIVRPLPVKKILTAATIEEIILLLDDTPYKKPLMGARDKFKERGSVFYLESALDMDYYTRLGKCIDGLSPQDKKIARRILGVAVDIENINWLIRLRKYYALGMGEMLEGVLPGGTWVTKDKVREFYASDGLAKVVESVALGPYAGLKNLVEDNVLLIENFLYDFLSREIKKALSGFPFTIGTVIGYLFLKHQETRNIISLFNAKRFGLKKSEFEPLLNA
ncbi:MAG: V-type ATPase subunit [Candidatus Omnitrophica bacterium]|nr:V-type ATPase subunit [Candidatus Omnitrophota bacterium]